MAGTFFGWRAYSTLSDRKSTRLNSSHPSTSDRSALSLHDALPICSGRGHRHHRAGLQSPRPGIAGSARTQDACMKLCLLLSVALLPVSARLASASTNGGHILRVARLFDPLRSEEHTSELQSPVHLGSLRPFPTRRSSDLFRARPSPSPCWPSISSARDCRKCSNPRRVHETLPPALGGIIACQCAAGIRFNEWRAHSSGGALIRPSQIGRAHV